MVVSRQFTIRVSNFVNGCVCISKCSYWIRINLRRFQHSNVKCNIQKIYTSLASYIAVALLVINSFSIRRKHFDGKMNVNLLGEMHGGQKMTNLLNILNINIEQ